MGSFMNNNDTVVSSITTLNTLCQCVCLSVLWYCCALKKKYIPACRFVCVYVCAACHLVE